MAIDAQDFVAPIPQDFAVGDESMASTEWNPWIPLGETGWRPNLPARTLGGPETDQPRTNLDGTITYLTNAEAMASEVQRALDRAGRIGPTPPVTSIESQLQALTELAQTDPTIAARYTTPGSQDLIDIATQVDSFAGMPTPSVPLPPQLARPAPTPEPTPEPARVKRSKKVKKAKTQAQTTKARRRKKVKDVKVKSVAKTSKVTKSAASQALSRARGNVKDANTIAKITKSFTAAKKKDPKVYMPTIRRAPSGAWVGGF